MSGFVYLLTNKPYGTLYVGVTNDLQRRIWEHREAPVDGFTKRYGLTRLLWYEMHESIIPAIEREKQIKRWRRDWKINLIQEANPHWHDLYADLTA